MLYEIPEFLHTGDLGLTRRFHRGLFEEACQKRYAKAMELAFGPSLPKHHDLPCPQTSQSWAIGPDETDFFVEEVPSYLPAGQGEHLFLFIEKRGLSTFDLKKRLCAYFHLKDFDIGTAGMKDARAITRQWVSVHLTPEQRRTWDPTRELDFGLGIKVLEQGFHDAKLRTGHLKGNRFVIKLMNESAGPDAANSTSLLDQVKKIAEDGFPNYFGPQRFGRDGDNVLKARKILSGDHKTRLRKPVKRLLVSSYQSHLFNRYVYERKNDSLEGDVQIWGQISGPMFGTKLKLADGASGDFEKRILEQEGVELDRFQGLGFKVRGTRRAICVKPGELKAKVLEDGVDSGKVKLSFFLPKGSYATVLVGFLTGNFHRIGSRGAKNLSAQKHSA